MRLDSRNPEFARRNLAGTLVQDLATGEYVRKVVWADDVTGEYEAWHCDEAGNRILFAPCGRRVGVETEFTPRLLGLLGGDPLNRMVRFDEGSYDGEARPRTYRRRSRLRFIFPYDSNPPRRDILRASV